MVQAAKDGAQVINLSLGLETDDDEPPIALEAAVEIISERWPHVLLVAAAGNFGHDKPCWPAAFKGVTAVGGLDRRLKPAIWSSFGSWVDCSTIGEAVLSTYVEGVEEGPDDPNDPNDRPDEYPENAWAIWTGTSFAAPQVSGAVAQLAQDRGISPRDALALLLFGLPHLPGFGRRIRILPPR
jgi:subtilisin family serine protease